MDKTQKEKCNHAIGRLFSNKKMYADSQNDCYFIWQACLEANGIGEDLSDDLKENPFYNTDLGEPYEAGKEFKKSIENIAYGLAKMSREITESIEAGQLRAEEEPRIPEGYFKIGEAGQGKTDEGWTRAHVCAIADLKNGFTIITKPEDFRPIPAWKPKADEAVFALDDKGRVHVAAIRNIDENATDGYVYGVLCQDGDYSLWRLRNLKPFDASKIGKPWSEIV